MMRSNNNPLQYTNSDEDEDEFAPNPFRSGASVTSNGSADFLDSPSNNNTTNHPNQPSNFMQQGAPYGQQPQQAFYGGQGQGPQSQTQPQQPQQQQYYFGGQHQPPQYIASSMIPDPNSGMTGALPVDYQHHSQQHQQLQQQQRAAPPPVLTGIMDQNAGSFHNSNSNNNNANSGNTNSQQAAAPASLFSMRGLANLCCRSDQAILLFNVDTIDIYLRLKASLVQFHQPDQFRTNVIGDLVAQAAADAGHLPAEQAAAIPMSGDRKGPDLYGPFWLSMTLMFVLGVTANLSDYLHHQRRSDPDEEFEYDINHLLHAMYIVFGYSFAVPTIFWFACQCLALPAIPWAMWVCCYGYSLTAVLVGALVAWWLPYELWHWLVLGLASAASGLLLVRNLSTPLLGLDHAKAAPVLLAILAAHVIDFLVLKITFFP